MRPIERIAIVAVLLAVSAYIVAGIISASIHLGPFYPSGLMLVIDNEWGRVLTLDFVVSLAFGGCWLIALERGHWRRGVLLAVALVALGSPVLLIYLAVRTRRARSLRDLLIPSSAWTSEQ
jgi:hypothetical protein